MNNQLLAKYNDKTKRTKYYTYIAAVFTFAIVFANFYMFRSLQQQSENEVLNKVLISEYRNLITYYDEVLTMSARTATATGDLKWEKRYNEFVPKLDKAIFELNKLIPIDIQKKSTKKTSEANNALIAMETEAFELVRAGYLDRAKKLLFSEKYDEQKKIYSSGMAELNSDIDSYVTNKFKELGKSQNYRNLVVFFSLMITFFTWAALLKRNYNEKSRIEHELQHMSKLASIGEMSAGLGHEINNPLTIAMGNLHRLKRTIQKTGLENEKVFSLLEKQDVALDRIKKVTDGMRNFSRKDGVDDSHNFNPSEGISQMVEMVEYNFSQDGIKFDIQLNKNDFEVYGNESVFQQVIMNLLSNARDAMEDSEIKMIKISSLVEKSKIMISISDTGSGMSEEVQKKIFEPFYTSKAMGKGTGLGMSLVYSFITEMRGSIDVESDLGKGTSFTIKLPLSDKNS